MLNRIEEVHKRRRRRLLVSVALIPVLLVPIALAILGKIYVIQVTPSLFPEAIAHVESLQGTGLRLGRRYVLFSDSAQLEFHYEGHWPMRQNPSKKSLENVVFGQLSYARCDARGCSRHHHEVVQQILHNRFWRDTV